MLPDDLATPDRIAAIAALLGGTLLKSTLLLLVGGACALMARSAAAATRHLIWALTLTGVLVVPAAAAIVPAWRIPVTRWTTTPWQQPSGVSPVIAGASSNAVLAHAVTTASTAGIGRRSAVTRNRGDAGPALETTRPMPAVAAAPVYAAVEPVASTTDVPSTPVVAGPSAQSGSGASDLWTRVAAWLIGAWLVGVVVVFTPVLIGFVRLAALRRRARPMRGGRWALLVPSVMRELDVRRRVRFLELDGDVMPMTWGIRRPVVLLPAGDFDSTIEQRLDVLRHELAHVRRYDCLTQLIGQIACAVYWFNPLAWVAARQLRVEREHACDDEVLCAGSKASAYADYLLRVARTMNVSGVAALGGLAMARPSQLAGRLLAVLDDARRRGRLTPRVATRAAAAAMTVVAMVASVSPTPAAARAMAAGATEIRTEPVVVTTSAGAFGPAVVSLDVAEPTTPSLPPLAAAQLTAIAAANVTVPRPITGEPSPVALRIPETAAPCDRNASSGKKSSHTSSTTSNNGGKRWRVLWSEGDCSYELDARGEITYNRDVTDIESISSGGSFTLEQHIGDETRRLTIRPRSDGALERSYSVDGSRREYDAAARAWFAEALVALDRQTAFAVEQRVPAILERAGVNGVLQEISLLGSDYAKRRYFTKLLSMRQLDRTQLRQVVEQAGSEISSDYELAELLVTLAKLDAFGDDSHTAFVSASKTIDSDYEQRRALNALLRRDALAPATVEGLLDAASMIGSDYELAELLIDVSKRYAINERTRPAYIKAVGSIKSDYEHRRVLSAIVVGGGLTPSVTRALLEDAARITSDYELAEFLIQIGAKGTLDASTRDAYFAAADKIDSDYEHHRALTPLLKRDLLTKELARAILTSAARIDSDYECASLLVEVASAITIDDDLRPAFDRAADTIQGEYEYGRAMSAVRRRVTR